MASSECKPSEARICGLSIIVSLGTLQYFQFSSVQSLSHVRLFATPWIAVRQASLFITISQSSLRLRSIESLMPSSHLILGCPLLLPPIPPSIRVFSNESTFCIRLSYSKSWKMMLWKCCTQYASKFGKLSSGHRTGEGQFSFQSQRKAMPKNDQTTVQLYLFHMLAR